MHLTIRAELDYYFASPCEVLLKLEAARAADQAVHSEHLGITPPVDIARLDDSASGERRAVFTAEGDVKIVYEADVEMLARDASLTGVPASAVRDLPAEAVRYLWPSRYCPSDRFADFVCTEFPNLQGGDQVESILGWIRDHLTYKSGVSDSSTTALDTFVDRAGVCRDFTHLAISLIRAANIPARAVAAYAWKLEPPDMHAVVEVYLGGRWRLVDPTGLAPVGGLVRVAWGMDAADIAFMTVFGSTTMIAQSFSVDAPAEAAPQAA